MISEQAIMKKFIAFTQAAAPILSLKDEQAYEDALMMMEHLLELVGEDEKRPENFLIQWLAQAINDYESRDKDVTDFLNTALAEKNDLALLRMIIDQYELTLSDLPEIGHKSLVSKILSGQRNMTRSHIEKISRRFHIDPGLFF